MSTLLRLISCVALVGLLGSSLYADTIVFSDDFESGNLNLWTVAPSPSIALDAVTTYNRTPTSGTWSALVNGSWDRMYHNLGSEVSGPLLRFTYHLYDDTQARAFNDIRAYAGTGFNDGGLQQLLAIGKYNSATMPGESHDVTKYQGRISSRTAGAGWFSLNAPTAPSRSAGWHRFDVDVEPSVSGLKVSFYVDGLLGRSFDGATAATFDSIVIGSVGSGGTVPSAGNAWVDGVSLAIVPEPGSIALVASGLAALVGLALWRRRSA